MTKKDFELIASAVNELFLGHTNWHRSLEQVANKLAEKLAEKNPRFNKEKFLLACGVESEKMPECPLQLIASVDAFNAGFGKTKRRAFFCKEAREWVIQEKQEDKKWLCLHN